MNECWKNPGGQSRCSPLPTVNMSPVLPSQGPSLPPVLHVWPCVPGPDTRVEVFWEPNMESGLGDEGQGGSLSGRRPLSQWRRGLRPRGAGPDPQWRWAGGKGRGDSGCGTSALSSPGWPSPVSAYTPAGDKMTTQHTFLSSTMLQLAEDDITMCCNYLYSDALVDRYGALKCGICLCELCLLSCRHSELQLLHTPQHKLKKNLINIINTTLHKGITLRACAAQCDLKALLGDSSAPSLGFLYVGRRWFKCDRWAGLKLWGAVVSVHAFPCLQFLFPLHERLPLTADVFGQHASQLPPILQFCGQSPVVLCQQQTRFIHRLRQLICCLLV